MERSLADRADGFPFFFQFPFQIFGQYACLPTDKCLVFRMVGLF